MEMLRETFFMKGFITAMVIAVLTKVIVWANYHRLLVSSEEMERPKRYWIGTLKKKIEDYTLLKDKNIEYVQLWEKYLCYAVSFGISNKIINCIDGLNIDDDLEKLVSSEFMSSYLDTNYYYFYNNASLDKIFMKRYGEITRDSIGKWTSSSGGGSSGGGGGFSGGGSSSSGGGGSGGGRRSILKYLI